MLLNIATVAAMLIFAILMAIEIHNALEGDRWDNFTPTTVYDREEPARYREHEIVNDRRPGPTNPKTHIRGQQSHARGIDAPDADGCETPDSGTDSDSDSDSDSDDSNDSDDSEPE